MNLFIRTAFVAAVVLVPALAFAQSNQTVTRAQVRAELIQLEAAGFNPDCSMGCDASLRRAQAVIAQQQANAKAGYGPNMVGTVQSGK